MTPPVFCILGRYTFKRKKEITTISVRTFYFIGGQVIVLLGLFNFSIKLNANFVTFSGIITLLGVTWKCCQKYRIIKIYQFIKYLKWFQRSYFAVSTHLYQLHFFVLLSNSEWHMHHAVPHIALLPPEVLKLKSSEECQALKSVFRSGHTV